MLTMADMEIATPEKHRILTIFLLGFNIKMDINDANNIISGIRFIIFVI